MVKRAYVPTKEQFYQHPKLEGIMFYRLLGHLYLDYVHVSPGDTNHISTISSVVPSAWQIEGYTPAGMV